MREVVGYDLEVKDKGASEAVAKVDKRTAQLMKQVEALDKALKTHSVNNSKLKSDLKELNTRYREVTKATNASAKGNIKLSAQAVALRKRNDALSASLAKLKHAHQAQTAQQARAAAQMRLTAQASSLMSGRLGQLLTVAGRFGPVLLVAAAGVWALYKAIKAFAGIVSTAVSKGVEFERRIAEIATISERSEFSIRGIIDTTTELASKFGVGIQTGAKALYQTISSGATTAAGAARVLTAAVKLSIGGLAELPTSVDALTSSMNSYRLTNLTAEQAADAMFTTVRYGKTTMQELAGQLGNVVSFAAGANLSFKELNAALTTLTLRGVKTQKAAIQVRQAMAQIIKPTSLAKTEAKRLGVEFSAAALKAKGLVNFLRDIQSNSKFTSGTFSRLFGNVRALNAVNAIMIDQGYELEDQLKNQAENAGAADRATDIMQKTTAQLVDRVMALKDSFFNVFGNVIAESETVKTFLRALVGYMDDLVAYAKTDDFEKMIDKWIERFRKLALVIVKGAKALSTFVDIFVKGAIWSYGDEITDAVNESKAFSKFNLGKKMGTIPLNAVFVPPEKAAMQDGVDQALDALEDSLRQAANKKRAPRPEEILYSESTLMSHAGPNMSVNRRLTNEELQAARDAADERERLFQLEQDKKNKSNAAARAWARELAQINRMQLQGQNLVIKLRDKELQQARDKKRATEQQAALDSQDLRDKRAQLRTLNARERGLQAQRGAAQIGIQGASGQLNSARTKEQAKAALNVLNRYKARYADIMGQLNTVDSQRKKLLDNAHKQLMANIEAEAKRQDTRAEGLAMVADFNQEALEQAQQRETQEQVRQATESNSVALKRQVIATLDAHTAALERQDEALSGSLSTLQTKLMSATEQEEMDAILAKMREFLDARKAIQEQLNQNDRNRAEVVKSVSDQIIETQKKQADIQATVARGLVGAYSDIMQSMIKDGANAEKVMKLTATKLIQLMGQVLTQYMTMSATKQATQKGVIVGNAAVAGSEVGASAAASFGPLALAVAPAMIAAMVGIITALTSTFHEGGRVGPGGKRIPLNLGPQESMAIVRQDEMILPTARMRGTGQSSGGNTTINVNAGFLSNPSNASFGRMIDDDVAPQLRRGISSGRVTLNDNRTYRRTRS